MDWCSNSDDPARRISRPNLTIGSKQPLLLGVSIILFTFFFYAITYDRLSRKFDESLSSLIARSRFKPAKSSDSTTTTFTGSLLPHSLALFPQPPLPETINHTGVCSDYVIFSDGFKDHRRLGNQIFNYAVGFNVAELTGRRLAVNDSRLMKTELEKVFQLKFDRYNETCPVYHIGDARHLAYNEKFEELVHNRKMMADKTIRLGGFFQSWKYTRLEDELRNRLVFRENLMVFAQKLFRANIPLGWNRGFFTRVGIHVRRGDIN